MRIVVDLEVVGVVVDLAHPVPPALEPTLSGVGRRT
jgi:hypothetical protein